MILFRKYFRDTRAKICKLQSLWIGRQTRRMAAERKQAIVMIQAVWRTVSPCALLPFVLYSYLLHKLVCAV